MSYTFYVCKGGRNSAKSTTISQSILFDIIDLPINALIVRKVERTLAESVYEQLKEAARILGVQESFHFQKSPLKIIYKLRGNAIIFRGADDPQKLKSLKTSEFPIARVWIEELSDFKTEEEVQSINDTVLRAALPDGLTYKIFYSYNPPKRKQHWLNKKYESQILPANTFVHHSTYLNNPYLPQQTLDFIEDIKKTNEIKYKWIYLGEPIGGGILPFNNLVFRKITDDEIKSFDNIRQGIDWGYATDPFAFVRLHLDKKRRRIFFIDEIYGVKKSNRQVINELKDRKYNTTMTIADSAEPKSVDEFKLAGIKIKGAKKGEGSVEYGEKWLDELDEIVIDVNRTPHVAQEFESIDYQVDRDGNQIARLEDKDNHTIDGSRYACEGDMARRERSGELLSLLGQER
jgi:phage terminase large subunit